MNKTPKEKASELLTNYWNQIGVDNKGTRMNINAARDCAILLTEEVLSNIQDAYNLLVPQTDELGQKNLREDYQWWLSVKQELLKL